MGLETNKKEHLVHGLVHVSGHPHTQGNDWALQRLDLNSRLRTLLTPFLRRGRISSAVSVFLFIIPTLFADVGDAASAGEEGMVERQCVMPRMYEHAERIHVVLARVLDDITVGET